MANLTENKQLVKPLSNEKYSIEVFNNNADIIDTELHSLDVKNTEQGNKLLSMQENVNNHKNNKENPHEVTASQLGLGKVENKSSEDIRNEITKENVTTALGYEPYTRNEVDNKLSALETKIDWKESVETYNDIKITYPDPEDGWTVNVKDTNYTWRYNGEEWVSISANSIPKATNELDGLLSKEDHEKYDSAIKKIDSVKSSNDFSPNNIKFWAGDTEAFDNVTVKDENTVSIVTSGEKAGLWYGALQVLGQGGGERVTLIGTINMTEEPVTTGLRKTFNNVVPSGTVATDILLAGGSFSTFSNTATLVSSFINQYSHGQFGMNVQISGTDVTVNIENERSDAGRPTGIINVYLWTH